jgi:hypothetical protein
VCIKNSDLLPTGSWGAKQSSAACEYAMKSKKLNNSLKSLTLILIIILALVGCNGIEDLSLLENNGSSSTVNTSDSITVGEWDIVSGENDADLVENYSFNTLMIDLDSMTVSSRSSALVVADSSNDATHVNLEGDNIITITEEAYGITIESHAPEDSLIEFSLYGGFNQTVTIYSVYDFKLSLNSVTIDSSDGPAINIQSKKRAFVELPDGSVNTLSDTSTWSDRYLDDGDEMDLKGTIFSEGPLVFSGNGSLSITANKKHALASDGHVRLREGSIVIESYNKDGVRSNDAFIMDDGDLVITTSSGKGIKVEGKEDDTAPIGFIAINEGSLTIHSYDKAITATWESDEDGDTTTEEDDPDPRVTINGGIITITTTGTPIEDELAPEGIEAKSVLTVNDGDIDIDATDDALNAGTGIIFNGSYTHAVSSDNDAIDSNGILTITDGVIVANGAGNAEGGLDNDSNRFTVSGGLFVGIGGRNSTPTQSATTQNVVSLRSVRSGLLAIEDSSGDVAFAYDMPESSEAVLLSGPDLLTGATYTVYSNGSIGSYSEVFNGLYVSPSSHSGGRSGSSFRITSSVTSL